MRTTPRLRALAAWVLMGLMAAPGLARDPNDFGDQPPDLPEPRPLTVKIPRGKPVWITLSAYTISSPVIRFRIKRQSKGELGTPDLVTEGTGQVKYTPPPGVGPGQDSFEYQVQSEAGVSAAAEVDIQLTDKDPVLVAPNEVDFGDVLPGESSTNTLVVQNIGGGLAEGKVTVPDGWTVQGDPAYKLGANEKRTFTLVFTPAEERKYMGDVQYTSEPGRATDLDGKGVGPIAFPDGPLVLQETGSARGGSIELRNRTDTARVLEITAGPELETGTSIEVPAKGNVDITVQVKPTETGAVSDQLSVQGDGVSQEVQVYAAALPTPTPAELEEAVAGPVGRLGQSAAPAQSAPAVIAAAEDTGELGDLPPLDNDGEPAPTPQPGTPIWGMAVVSVKGNKAEVACNFKGAGPVQSYRVEVETLGIDASGRPEAVWVPLPNTTVKVNGTMVLADIAKLKGNAIYLVRLAGLDDQGRTVAASAPGRIVTPKAADLSKWRWTGVGVVLLMVAAVWKWLRGRR